MSTRRSFTAPVWWLLLVVVLKFTSILIIVDHFRNQFNFDIGDNGVQIMHSILVGQVLTQSLVILIFIAEAIVYWRLRAKNITRKWAWVHVILLLVGCSLAPVLLTMYQLRAQENKVDFSVLSLLAEVRTAVVWGSFIIAHIYFTMMLVDYNKERKNKKEEVVPNGPDLLDDYAS